MWDVFLEVLPQCGPLVGIAGFLLWLVRRETKEKTYWREKTVKLLGLSERTVKVASDLAEEL